MLYGQDSQAAKSDRDFHTLTIRVPPNLHQRLDQLARADGETVASVVRQMLRSGLEVRQGAK